MINQAHTENRLLVLILAIGMLLGGCTLHPQQEAPAQHQGHKGTTPNEETVSPEATPPNPAAHGDALALLVQPPDTADTPSADGHDSDDMPLTQGAGTETDTVTSGEADSDEDTADMWDRIRQSFAIPEQDNTRIRKEIEWFSRNQDYLDRVAQRAQPYLHYIVNEVERRGMPTEIALLPVVESAFQPYAYSSGRAAGIWQFIPGTGRRYGLKLNWWYDGRRDIAASTRAALDYLQYLHDTFDGDWLLALAAYNSGEGTVLKAVRANQRHHKPTDYWSLRLPRETEQYVPRLLALRDIVADPEQQGVRLISIADEAYLTAVNIDSQLDLATAAKMAEMDLEELYQLNPGFNRWATAPDGPHRLLLPLDKAAIFATNVAGLSDEDRVHWVRHRVRNGETLGEIALRYRTTVKVLTDLNKIRGHFIRHGQYLIIPITNKSDPVYKVAHKPRIPKEVANAAEKTIHTVATGDSLWLLARRYGTTVQQLSRWNGISTRKPLQPGQKIIVGLGDAGDNSAANIPASQQILAAPQAAARPRKITYTVRKGDSLARISQRFKVTVQKIRKWNDLKKDHYLQPGQLLTLYVPLTADSERG